MNENVEPERESEELDYIEKIKQQNLLFDNEWIKFMSELSKNRSIGDIVEFIKKCEWTDRQKTKIMAYSQIILGNNLGSTYITSENDMAILYDDKALVDVDLPLGMTRYDLTPEYNILFGMINYHFGVESRKSKGGFFTKRIGAQRNEIIHEEEKRENEGVWNKFGWGK